MDCMDIIDLLNRSIGARMKITLRQLQIFVAVARTSSTAEAGRSLPLSQSATSAAINDIENLLGTRLFDRVGKRLVLNDNGRLLLPSAISLLEGAMDLEQQFIDAKNGQSSQLRLGASTTIGNYILPGIIAGCRRTRNVSECETQPGMRLDVANSSKIAASVANYEIDAGFIEGNCHEPNLKVIPWLEDELLIVASPLHPLSSARNANIGMLQKAIWLMREPESGTRETVEYELLRHLGRLRIGMELGGAEAIKRATSEGLGISCLSRWVVADYLESGMLVEIRTDLPKLTRRFHILLHRQKYLSENLKKFLNHCAGVEMFPMMEGREGDADLPSPFRLEI